MSVTTRRERREQEKRRRRRQGRSRAASGPDRSSTFITIGIIAVALIGGVLLLRQLGVFEATKKLDINSNQFDVTSQAIGTKFKDEGNVHVPDGQTVTYATTPPTSGSHWANPAPWGIKDNTLPDEQTTHNLEHGGIVIDYNGLSPDDLASVKTIVRTLLGQQYRKIILQPYAKLTDAQIALSAWTWQLKLGSYDETQIVKFVKAHYQGPDAPEPNAN